MTKQVAKFWVLCLIQFVTAVKYSGYRKVDISFTQSDYEETATFLKQFTSFDEWSGSYNKISFTISGEDLVHLEEQLDPTKVQIFVHQWDLQDIIDATVPSHRSDYLTNFNTFLSGDEYAHWIEETKSSDAGTLSNGIVLEVESIGLSYLGAEIPSFTFSRTSEKKRPAVGLDCAIHAREWISPAMCRMLVNELIRCSKTSSTCDDFFMEHFYDFDWYIIPMINPDGYSYTWTSDRMWRKNRSPSTDGPCIGTDLNRNSDVAWGTQGASDNTCSNSYHGVAPFSEPSMKSWVNYYDEARNSSELYAYISMHSYAQKIISAWAVAPEVFPDAPFSIDLMNESGRRISEAMTAEHNVEYTYGQSRDILYPSSGTSKDYLLHEWGVPLSWTWELRDTGDFGFLLPENQIQPQWDEVKAGLNQLLQYIKEHTIH